MFEWNIIWYGANRPPIKGSRGLYKITQPPVGCYQRSSFVSTILCGTFHPVMYTMDAHTWKSWAYLNSRNFSNEDIFARRGNAYLEIYYPFRIHCVLKRAANGINHILRSQLGHSRSGTIAFVQIRKKNQNIPIFSKNTYQQHHNEIFNSE